MSIEQRLDEKLKSAMKARDARTVGLVRMLRAKMTERRKEKGFSGEIDDVLWQEVIGAYAKSLQKALPEYERSTDERARAQADELRWEIAQLEEFLPRKAGEAQTRAWVEQAIAGLGGREKARLGAVVGAVMKAHKPEADPALVRRIAEQELGQA